MILLGLTGRARSGKGVVARAIQDDCKGRLDCKIYEISDYVLADMNRLGKLPGKTRSMLDKEDLSLLVQHGHWMRSRDEFYWLDYVTEDIDKDKPDVAILPNIRFRNEAEFIWSSYQSIPRWESGKIIRVRSLLRDGLDYISPDRDPNDSMEYENLSIDADYFLSVKRGQTTLLKKQAVTLFDYIIHEAHN